VIQSVELGGKGNKFNTGSPIKKKASPFSSKSRRMMARDKHQLEDENKKKGGCRNRAEGESRHKGRVKQTQEGLKGWFSPKQD